MGKSSGSLKKKRSRNSSKAKAGSRSKKIRKHKSKKVRRREVSLSSSDSDDSKSIDTSLSSSSSEERYRRKRDRSRTRKDGKGRKKRARRHSSSSSEDSLIAKKKKKEKRKSKYDETREKPRKKKKIRREDGVSLMKKRSLSCSTGQDGSASNDDSECETSRGRSERKEKSKTRLRGRSGTKKSSRYRPRSSSSCSSPHGDSKFDDIELEETHMFENKSRWLRSIITIPKAEEESRELCGNENIEEVVDDHDYPCRSNDSNDGGTTEKLDHDTHPLSEEKLRIEDEIGNVNADLNITELNLRDRSCSDRSSPKAYNAETSESMKKETNDTSGANLNGDDLETILRQRALENLRKYRGVQSTAKASEQKNKIVGEVKQPITAKKELVRGKSPVSNAVVGTKLDKQAPVEKPRPSGSAKHHLVCEPEKVIDADIPSGVVTASTNNKTGNLELTTSESCHDVLQSGPSVKKIGVSRFAREKTVVKKSIEDNGKFEATHVMSYNSNNTVNDIGGMPSAVPKPSIHQPELKQNNSNTGRDDISNPSQSESNKISDSQEPSTAKLPLTDADENRNVAKTTQSAIQSINSSGRDVDESCNAASPESGFKSSSVENNPSMLPNESNQGSQFEQKTMSVMRGGEMVQVSYKVYIPKKAPGLARRQLKR